MVVSPDWRLFEWINGLSGNATADAIMKFISNDYFLTVVLTMGLLLLWFGGRSLERRRINQWSVVWAASGVGFSTLVVHILNRVFDFDPFYRPFVAAAEGFHSCNLVFGYEPSDPTFPANSAAVAFAFATGVFMGNRKAGSVMYFIAALWGLSRIYVGIHYPLDIFHGAMIGILITYLFRKALHWTEPLPSVLLGTMKLLHVSDIPEVNRIRWGIFKPLAKKFTKP